MLEEENKNLPVEQKTENDLTLDQSIDKALIGLSLDEGMQLLSNQIVNAPSKEELDKLLDVFNFQQKKIDTLRMIKLNDLLGKVENQATERFEKRPDQVSNDEILKYMQVVSGQIDRIKTSINEVSDKPLIKVGSVTNQQVNIVGPQYSRESKEKVVDAITALLKQVNQQVSNSENKEIQEDEITIISTETEILNNDENE